MLSRLFHQPGHTLTFQVLIYSPLPSFPYCPTFLNEVDTLPVTVQRCDHEVFNHNVVNLPHSAPSVSSSPQAQDHGVPLLQKAFLVRSHHKPPGR